MNFAILVVLVLQMDWALCCTFQKKDGVMYVESLGVYNDEASCFALCLNRKECTGLCYNQNSRYCAIFFDGNRQKNFPASYQCYSYHRDLVKPPQYSRILNFIRKNSYWSPV